jgi:DNA-binding IclR family transcriptional regulator
MQYEEFDSDCDGSVIKSAKRALQLLELLKEAPEPLSTTDIAVQLNYPFSSTAALLKSLVKLGYLIFDRNARTYHASLRVGLLGSSHARGPLAKLTEISDRLAADSQQTILLAIRNEIHVQYIRIMSAGAPSPFDLQVGGRQRLVDAAMGHALLSLDEDSAIDRLARRANADRRKDQRYICPIEFGKDVHDIRRKGFAYSDEGFIKGAGVVAAPFTLSRGEPPLAIGIAGLAAEIKRELPRLAELVCEAAGALNVQTAPESAIKHVAYRRPAAIAPGASQPTA